MKRRYLFVIILLAATCLVLCAFKFDKDSSLKDLTHPYINTYECTAARLGKEDLLEKYEYFKITFLDEKQLEISFKKNKGKKRVYKCDYDYDDKTHEFYAETGIFGFKFKQRTKIYDGKFTISMPILGKPLIMNFAVK